MDTMLLVTIAAVGLAAIMSLVAWRTVRDERRRSEARIAALAAEIHQVHPSVGDNLPLRHAAVAPRFTAANAARPRRAVAAVLGAGALVVAIVAAVLFLATTGADPIASSPGAVERPAAAAVPPPTAAPATPTLPLELVALSHEREQDRLVVRGTIRNPGLVPGSGHLTAVVLLFNAEGGFLTSGRAEVSAKGIAAGTESRFVVTIPGAAEVGRYRVSFRSDDRVVPHVDRRQS